jgi:chemotaxis protein methyltransferase CheR
MPDNNRSGSGKTPPQQPLTRKMILPPAAERRSLASPESAEPPHVTVMPARPSIARPSSLADTVGPARSTRYPSIAVDPITSRFRIPTHTSQLDVSIAERDRSEPEPRPMRAEVFAGIQSWAQRNCGLSFSSEQYTMFEARIEALCRELRVEPDSILNRLSGGDADMALRVAEALSTNYTFFRREPEMFEYLASQIFPKLTDGPIRIWSAATSSGDEAYSIAMAAYDHYGTAALARVRILGTDLSERQIRAAEQGIYPRAQLTQLGDAHVQRWFKPVGGDRMQVESSLQQLCTFRRFNLTQGHWPFENGFHVIFLRNVLYYFEAPLRRLILEKCYDAAMPGAVLITSLTEPMINVQTRWRSLRPAVFVREGR